MIVNLPHEACYRQQKSMKNFPFCVNNLFLNTLRVSNNVRALSVGMRKNRFYHAQVRFGYQIEFNQRRNTNKEYST